MIYLPSYKAISLGRLSSCKECGKRPKSSIDMRHTYGVYDTKYEYLSCTKCSLHGKLNFQRTGSYKSEIERWVDWANMYGQSHIKVKEAIEDSNQYGDDCFQRCPCGKKPYLTIRNVGTYNEMAITYGQVICYSCKSNSLVFPVSIPRMYEVARIAWDYMIMDVFDLPITSSFIDTAIGDLIHPPETMNTPEEIFAYREGLISARNKLEEAYWIKDWQDEYQKNRNSIRDDLN